MAAVVGGIMDCTGMYETRAHQKKCAEKNGKYGWDELCLSCLKRSDSVWYLVRHQCSSTGNLRLGLG